MMKLCVIGLWVNMCDVGGVWGGVCVVSDVNEDGKG